MNTLKNQTRFLILLMVISNIGPIALNMPVPALPSLATAFKTTPENVQLTLTLYLLGMGASQIIMGPLSDRFGRRPIVLIGLAIGTFFSILALFAPNIETLIIARFFQALGATSGVVLGRAMIRDLYQQDKAASMIGWVTMGMMIGPMVTPLLGGVMTDIWGHASIFWVIAALTIIAMVFALIDLPETRKIGVIPPTFISLAKDCFELLQNRNFWGFCLLGSFSSVTFFAFLGGAPYVVITLMKASPAEYGAWFALSALGYALGNSFCGKYSESWGGR
jgi:MFS transporter, DHA1 family, multidrug resistance protein